MFKENEVHENYLNFFEWKKEQSSGVAHVSKNISNYTILNSGVAREACSSPIAQVVELVNLQK